MTRNTDKTYCVQGTVDDGTGPRTFGFESRSKKWEKVTRGCRHSRPVNGVVTVQLPNDLFTRETFVPDANKFDWDGNQLIDRTEDEWSVGEFRRRRRRRGRGRHVDRVLLVNLESPHTSEYGPSFSPRWPLMDATSAASLHRNLPKLIAIMNLLGPFKVIISNPVRWQASLARCIPDKALQEKVRDETWTALYYAACKNDFTQRVKRYSPDWVLNACTTSVRGRVSETLIQNLATTAHIWETDHPSSSYFNNAILNRIQ